MRLLWIGIGCVLAQPTLADDQCVLGSSKPLTVQSWSANKVDDAQNNLTVQVQSNLKKPVHLVQALGSLIDVLGQPVTGYMLPPDTAFAPGELKTITLPIGSSYSSRLLTVRPADVVARMCTQGIVYDDGTKETFD